MSHFIPFHCLIFRCCFSMNCRSVLAPMLARQNFHRFVSGCLSPFALLEPGCLSPSLRHVCIVKLVCTDCGRGCGLSS